MGYRIGMSIVAAPSARLRARRLQEQSMTTKQSSVEFPFASNLIESLELMRKVWGAGFPQVPGTSSPAALVSSLPSMMVPTLDVDELDKRIGDLRAVEQWLALNAGMLRASIQTLEVQRNTIATL